MSSILVTLTSRSDSNFERSNIRLKENIRDGVDPNYNGLNYCVRKNEGKILWFSADCIIINTYSMKNHVLLYFEHKNDVTIIVKLYIELRAAGEV